MLVQRVSARSVCRLTLGTTQTQSPSGRFRTKLPASGRNAPTAFLCGLGCKNHTRSLDAHLDLTTGRPGTSNPPGVGSFRAMLVPSLLLNRRVPYVAREGQRGLSTLRSAVLRMKGPAGKGEENPAGLQVGTARDRNLRKPSRHHPRPEGRRKRNGKGLFTPSHVLKAGLLHIRLARE
jgi:hypothetical protein